MPKQKIAVRDKFYTLAKEQGYRARSAFKLLQLNRKYGLLDDCSRAIDLCAAPGGWLQVLAKAMPPRPERQIIGVDLLPIKPLRGCVTFQADITTAECRRLIRHELKGNQADVVLCDGAPNVGSAFNKDAFVQSELALAALRFATDHLRRGGSFVTKVFRSADYNALIWCFQQLFRKVEATKPTSSRNVSAEIFVVCREYIAPDKIDPKLLDPKYVFAQVTPDDAKDSKMSLSLLLGEDKKNVQRKFRAGYEDNAGALISKRVKAADFIKSEDPVRVLTEATELVFPAGSDGEVDETDAFVASHPTTTAEIKLLCADIQVLGKGDFKHLIKWRMALLKDLKKLEKVSAAMVTKDTEAEDDESDEGEDDDEIELGKALLSLEERRKKEEKRMRKQQAKLQRHKDQGLIHPFAYDLADQDVPFSIKSLGVTSTKDARLDGFREGERVNRSVQQDDDDDDEDESEPEESYSDLIEKQLEADYERYSRRKELNEPMTVQERRRQLVAEKKAKKKKSALERMTEEDFQRALEEAKLDAYNKGVYAKMLRKGTLSNEERENGSSSSDDDDDGEEEEREEQDDKDENESLNEQDDEEQDDESKQKLIERAKAKRWFEQQVFHDPVLMEDEDDDEEDSIDPESIPLPRDLLDKEKRKLKRKKEDERKERKRLRKENQEQAALGAEDELPVRKTKKDVEIVPATSTSNGKTKKKDLDLEEAENDYDFDEDDAREQLKNKRELDPKFKSLIEKGMGKLKSDASSKSNNKIEVVKNNSKSTRNKSNLDSEDEDSDTENLVEAYNSDEYDSDERAEHLALGALLAKKSTRSAVLDAAYNRYAFNDDTLPAWFAEDESRHNRPNLPITKEMVESVKARFSDMNDRPIKKVAEARMRKKKRAIKKLEDAKRKAAAIVEEPDLSGRSKIRTIEKLFKGATVKRPGSVYVVSQKGGAKKTAGGKAGKGAKVKVVDPRMKKDMKAQKRMNGKGKGGGGKRKKHRSK